MPLVHRPMALVGALRNDKDQRSDGKMSPGGGGGGGDVQTIPVGISDTAGEGRPPAG